MNILIVDDQLEKCEDISNFFEQRYGSNVSFKLCHSLRAGLKELLGKDALDLVVLDMSMPSFDPSEDDPLGGTPESFAGQELLEQMALRDIEVPVVVITQYSTFNPGKITLEVLHESFTKIHPGFYLGIVYYSSVGTEWNLELEKVLRKYNL